MSDVKELNLYQKLSKVRVGIQNFVSSKKIKKSGLNTFTKFAYYNLNDFMPYVNQLFDEVGLLGKFDLNLDGVSATLIIFNTNKPDEFTVFVTPTADAGVKGSTAIQSLGATHTYLKRYLYQNAIELSDNDVFDPLQGSGILDTEAISEEQIVKISELYTEKEITDMLGRRKKASLGECTSGEADSMIDFRTKKPRISKSKPTEQKDPIVEKKVPSLDNL